MEQKENIISVKQHTTISRTVEYCEKLIAEPNFDFLVLVGEGKAVNKCISMCEIIKRKHTELKQECTLSESGNGADEPKLAIKLYK